MEEGGAARWATASGSVDAAWLIGEGPDAGERVGGDVEGDGGDGGEREQYEGPGRSGDGRFGSVEEGVFTLHHQYYSSYIHVSYIYI